MMKKKCPVMTCVLFSLFLLFSSTASALTITAQELTAAPSGHVDDVVFITRDGAKIPGGVALSDHSQDEHHNISETLMFQF